VEPAVKLEGAMTSLIVNPVPLPSVSDLTAHVATWLKSEHFADSSYDMFQSKWSQLSEPTQRVLAVLINEGGKDVKQSSVRLAFSTCHPADANAADQIVRQARQQFINTGLVRVVQNTHSGDELSVHPTWEFHIRRQLAK
jgi:hypothetical protein